MIDVSLLHNPPDYCAGFCQFLCFDQKINPEYTDHFLLQPKYHNPHAIAAQTVLYSNRSPYLLMVASHLF